MNNSIANELALKNQLFMLHMKEGGLLMTLSDEFTEIIHNLKQLDMKVENKDQTIILLCTWPPSYKNFQDIVIFWDSKTIILQEVKTA